MAGAQGMTGDEKLQIEILWYYVFSSMISSLLLIIEISLSHQSGFELIFDFDFADFGKWEKSVLELGKYYGRKVY